MDDLCEKKVALVTGGTKGIGKGIVIDLLKSGYFVFCNYSTDEAAANEASECFSSIGGSSFDVYKADLSKKEGALSYIEHIKSITDSINVVVLNVATTCKDDFEEIAFEDWTKVMDTNLNIPFFMIQQLNRNISENGRIVVISAILGIYPHSISIPYGVSKAGLNHLVRSLVKVFASKGVTINAICPGFVDTDWQKTKPIALRRKIENKIALKRFAEVSEISQFCMSLINNSYINGAIIPIDGGYNYE